MPIDEMTSEASDLAFLLDCFQASENHGRGCQATRSIAAYLYKGDITSAGSVRRIEGDKTRIHTNVELLLEMIFGCRIHLEHDCKTWICVRTSPARREALQEYGVKLVHYKGQNIGLWVHEDGERWSGSLAEARDKAREYDLRNPGGHYSTEPVS